MRLHLLGSSAGKPVPRPFCSCRVCHKARRDGGRDVRTRTGLQLYPLDTADEEFLTPKYQVDLSPDFVHQIIRDKIDISRLEHVLITHSDGDHLHTNYLDFRRSILTPIDDLPVLNIYGNELVESKIRRDIPDLDRVRCRFHKVRDGETFEVGSLQVTAFLAMHRGPRCLHYAVDDGRHHVLFAWDGMWNEDVWQRLRAWKFDAVGMECMHFGPADHDSESHLTYNQFVQTRNRLAEYGIIDENTYIFATHIGDNGGLTYDEAYRWAVKEGFHVGYDGMVVDIA